MGIGAPFSLLRIIRSAYRLRDLVNGICINRRLLCNSIKSRKGVYGSYNTRSNGKKRLFHHGKKARAKVAENESSCKNMTRPTEDTLQNSNDYLRQIDCLGFAGSATKRNAGCQDPAHCLSGFLSKAGSFLPGFIFSLCACKKSLRPALAFAYAEKGGDDSAAARGTSHLPFGRSFWKAVA